MTLNERVSGYRPTKADNSSLSTMQNSITEAVKATKYGKYKPYSENIYIAENRTPSKDEIKNAQLLAGKGHHIVFTPELHNLKGMKEFDAIMDGEKLDFKRVTGGIKAVGHNFRYGLTQAKHVSLSIEQDFSVSEIINKLKGELKNNPHKGKVFIYLEKKNKFYEWDIEKLSNAVNKK